MHAYAPTCVASAFHACPSIGPLSLSATGVSAVGLFKGLSKYWHTKCAIIQPNDPLIGHQTLAHTHTHSCACWNLNQFGRYDAPCGCCVDSTICHCALGYSLYLFLLLVIHTLERWRKCVQIRDDIRFMRIFYSIIIMSSEFGSMNFATTLFRLNVLCHIFGVYFRLPHRKLKICSEV